MSDRPRSFTPPPQIPPRDQRGPRRRVPMAERPGRDPQRPYIDHHASVGALARHIRIGLDMSKPMSTVNTRELALILDTMIGASLGGEAKEQFHAEIAAAYAGAAQAQEEMAMGVGEETP